MQVVQRCQGFLVVETGEEIAGFDGLALASAALDNPAANQRRRARPGLGLDRAGRIDDSRGRAAGDAPTVTAGVLATTTMPSPPEPGRMLPQNTSFHHGNGRRSIAAGSIAASAASVTLISMIDQRLD